MTDGKRNEGATPDDLGERLFGDVLAPDVDVDKAPRQAATPRQERLDLTVAWPATVPHAETARAILTGATELPELRQFTDEFRRRFSIALEAAFSPAAGGPGQILASGVVLLWRYRAALHLMPPKGGEMSKSALERLLAASDTVMSDLHGLAGDASLSAAATELRNELARDATLIASAEADYVRRTTQPSLPAVVSVPTTRLISSAVENEAPARSSRLRVLFAIVMLGGAAVHLGLYLTDAAGGVGGPSKAEMGTPSLESNDGTGTVKVYGVQAQTPADEARLQTLKAAAEAAGKHVIVNQARVMVFDNDPLAPAPTQKDSP